MARSRLSCPRRAPFLMALFLALGCSKVQQEPAPARRSFAGQTLRVYNFAHYLGQTTIPSFEEHTGSKVKLATYDTNEELLRHLDAGEQYDVVFPSSYAVDALIQKGRLREMVRDLVPNLVQVPERFRNPPVDPSLRHCIPYTWSLTGIGYLSPRDAAGRPPDSLKAIFSERGPRIIMLDDMRATMGVALRYLGHSANTRDRKEIESVRKLLLGLGPRVVRYAADAGPALRDGEVGLALAWSGHVLRVSQKRQEVRFVVPKEGTLLYVDYACVLKSSSQPELAFAFLNHLLNPQVAAEITNTQMFATPNLGAQRMLNPESRWLWGTLDAIKDQGRFEMIRDVGDALPLYEAAWRAIKESAPPSTK